MSGPIDIVIRHTIFRANEAPRGASLSLTAAHRKCITNTSTDKPVGSYTSAISVYGAAVAMCAENPCEAGEKCLFRDQSTFCDACGPNEIGLDGISCNACPPGTAPDAPQTDSLECAVGKFSTIGLCESCPGDRTSIDDRTGCAPCPVGLTPNARGAACECETGFYNATAGSIACNGLNEDFRDTDLMRSSSSVCEPCNDICMTCTHGTVDLKPGIAVSEANKHSSSGVHEIAAPMALFVCPFDGCLGQTNDTTKWLSACANGYTGALCAQCEDSWIRSGTECIECSDTTGQSVAVVVVIALILPGSVAVHKLGRHTSVFSGGSMVQAKIIIGLMQIVTELPHTLKLAYPQQFTTVIQAMRVLMLDIFDIFSIDCISTSLSLHARFIAVMLLPMAGLLVVLLLRFASNCQAEHTGGTKVELDARKAAIQATASYRAFFVLFMLYPLLSRTVFHMFGCHQLDVDERWHQTTMESTATRQPTLDLSLLLDLVWQSSRLASH